MAVNIWEGKKVDRVVTALERMAESDSARDEAVSAAAEAKAAADRVDTAIAELGTLTEDIDTLTDLLDGVQPTTIGAVAFTANQGLTDEQKYNARTNIDTMSTSAIRELADGAVKYTSDQNLSDVQKQQGRENIGAASTSDLSLKADKDNTVLTGTLSNGRSGNAGEGSFAFGFNAEASGDYSNSTGYNTHATNSYTHAEGDQTIAAGYAAHSQGSSTAANGKASDANGIYTIAAGRSQHVFGEYNKQEVVANADARGQYVEIVGNGTGASNSERSNCRTLDWNGNEILAGKLTVGAEPTADMDVATKSYVDDRSGFVGDAYDNRNTYLVDDYVTKNGKLYRCIANITTPMDWNEAYWEETTLTEQLARIAAKLFFEAISFNSLSIEPSKALKGATIRSAVVQYQLNKAPVSLTINSESVLDPAASGNIAKNGSWSSDQTFVVSATDEKGNVATQTKTLSFFNYVYWGVGEYQDLIDSTFVTSLSNKELTGDKVSSITVTAGEGQYVWYALPQSMGECTFSVNGFAGGFSTKINMLVTNSNSFSEYYNIYRSDNANLGTTTITIS